MAAIRRGPPIPRFTSPTPNGRGSEGQNVDGASQSPRNPKRDKRDCAHEIESAFPKPTKFVCLARVITFVSVRPRAPVARAPGATEFRCHLADLRAWASDGQRYQKMNLEIKHTGNGSEQSSEWSLPYCPINRTLRLCLFRSRTLSRVELHNLQHSGRYCGASLCRLAGRGMMQIR